MGLHLSRTPHIPAHLAHLYPPQSQPRLHRELSISPTPTSVTTTSISSLPAPTTPHRTILKPRSRSLHVASSSSSSSHPQRSHSSSHSHSRPRVRLPPPPARSAMKKPRKRPESVNSSVTPDTASGSTVSSSVAHPSTPTRHTSGLLTRFLRPNKERRVPSAASSSLVVIVAEPDGSEPEPGPERKAVRFGDVAEEEES
jgi:hypothetical protein